MPKNIEAEIPAYAYNAPEKKMRPRGSIKPTKMDDEIKKPSIEEMTNYLDYNKTKYKWETLEFDWSKI